MEYACPICGAGVSADASSCPSCGEDFATNGQNDYDDDGVAGLTDGQNDYEEVEEVPEVPEDELDADTPAMVDGTSELELDEEEIVVEETTEIEYLPVEDVEEADNESADVYGDEGTVEIDDDPDDLMVQDTLEEADGFVEDPEEEFCTVCDASLIPGDEVCGECGEPVPVPTVSKEEEADGCPSCGAKEFTAQKNDMVSCNNCGNIYLKDDQLDGPDTSWKWKFWGGLIMILVGDFGFAFVSYVHNVARWSPLGEMYLGYGRMDSMLGAVGVIIFIVGLFLFAWSFKRDREVDCPSCGIHIRESDLLPVPEEEEETKTDIRISDVMEEIEDIAECPQCGAPTSIFDIECSVCGVEFDTEGFDEEILDEDFSEIEVGEGEFIEEVTVEETVEVINGEFDEESLIMDSLELKEEELEEPVVEDPDAPDNLELLESMESDLDIDDASLGEGLDKNLGDVPKLATFECPECDSAIEPGSKECPVCGSYIDTGGE